MRQYLKLLALFIIAIFLQSCDNMTEEIYLNEDGSGEYMMYSDMIPSMEKMAIEMARMFQDMDSTGEIKNMTDKELAEMMSEEIWSDFPEEIDSIIDITQELPDSVRDNPQKMAIIEKATMFMKGGKSKGYLNTGVKYPFQNLDDLDAFSEMMQQQNSNDQLPQMGVDVGKMKVDYSFANNTFSRTSTYTKPPQIDMDEEQEELLKKMLGGNVKTIIHLPKKIKKITGDNLKEKEAKTVIFEYNLFDSALGKVNSDFSIKMKKK